MKRNILHISLITLLLLVIILFILVINLYTRAKKTVPSQNETVTISIKPEVQQPNVVEEAIPETQAVYDKFYKYGIKPREAKYYEHE